LPAIRKRPTEGVSKDVWADVPVRKPRTPAHALYDLRDTRLGQWLARLAQEDVIIADIAPYGQLLFRW